MLPNLDEQVVYSSAFKSSKLVFKALKNSYVF